MGPIQRQEKIAIKVCAKGKIVITNPKAWIRYKRQRFCSAIYKCVKNLVRFFIFTTAYWGKYKIFQLSIYARIEAMSAKYQLAKLNLLISVCIVRDWTVIKQNI